VGRVTSLFSGDTLADGGTFAVELAPMGLEVVVTEQP
jgi:hypothetical protein